MIVTDTHVYFSKGVLDNWSRTPMLWDNKTFFSAEQLFMYLKAFCFQDDEITCEIAHAKTPKEAKDLGRLVKGFNNEEWDKIKFSIMYLTLKTKLRFSEEFHQTLIDNKGKIFVECNPEDNVWGIGLAEDDDAVLDEKNWNGENLLGQVLTLIAKNL